MALTTERIVEICAHLRDTVGCGDMTLARAIEAEVRKQYDALILQLVEALENSNAALWEEDDDPSRPVHAAITAGRARLEAKK